MSKTKVKKSNNNEKQDINSVVDGIISQMKSKGIFDKFRRECLSESETKPSYNNLHSRVTMTVETFLRELTWTPSFHKIKMNTRNQMRKRIEDARFFKPGIENIVEQCLRGKMETEFIAVIEAETFTYMGCDKKDQDEQNQQEEEVHNQQQHGDDAQNFQQEGVKTEHVHEQVDHMDVQNEPHQDEALVEVVDNDNKSDEDSEDESPMFEKIGEVSPPRPVLLENSEDILRELQEEARRNAELISKEQKPSIGEFTTRNARQEASAMQLENRQQHHHHQEVAPIMELPTTTTHQDSFKNDSPPTLTDETAVDLQRIRDECKFLEPPPLFKEKLAYYKKLPHHCGDGEGSSSGSGGDEEASDG